MCRDPRETPGIPTQPRMCATIISMVNSTPVSIRANELVKVECDCRRPHSQTRGIHWMPVIRCASWRFRTPFEVLLRGSSCIMDCLDDSVIILVYLILIIIRRTT